VAKLQDQLPIEKYFVTNIADCLSFPLNMLYRLKVRRERSLPAVPFDGKTVERILKARARPRPLEITNTRSASQCFALLPEIKQRPLEEYSGLFKETFDA